MAKNNTYALTVTCLCQSTLDRLQGLIDANVLALPSNGSVSASLSLGVANSVSINPRSAGFGYDWQGYLVDAFEKTLSLLDNDSCLLDSAIEDRLYEFCTLDFKQGFKRCALFSCAYDDDYSHCSLYSDNEAVYDAEDFDSEDSARLDAHCDAFIDRFEQDLRALALATHYDSERLGMLFCYRFVGAGIGYSDDTYHPSADIIDNSFGYGELSIYDNGDRPVIDYLSDADFN